MSQSKKIVSQDVLRETFDINVFAVVRLTQAATSIRGDRAGRVRLRRRAASRYVVPRA